MISRLRIGSDIAKRWFDIYFVIEKQEVEERYPNTNAGVQEFLARIAGLARRIHVCMEYTGGFETLLATACFEAGHVVSLVPGSKIAYYRKSFSSSGANTDKRSAYLLARYCQERKPEQWFPTPDEYRRLRELVRHREALVEGKKQWSCRAANFVGDELVAAQRMAIIEVLNLQIQQVQKEMAVHIQAHRELRHAVQLLDTIPCIAFISACKILAESGPIGNYSSAKAYVLAAGLAPIVDHSGMNTPQGKLPVYGNRELRSGFYFPAVRSFGSDKGVGPFMQRVGAKGGKLKMTLVVAGMRKLAHIAFGVLKNRTPYDPNLVYRKV